ncbi:type I-E CRISPR-associated protein Cas5/CasD [Kiritimatiella glycovorans]|uniref:CRISPR system Cascade subunit CasD n=1 Tax=Kiritimatiella glycovorans TaxID=1307763 RepID=A0A0G3EG53_9BACT|nr:type I-E CRISPR-associated protein Cas5/CasD [Kiritimatiella glycovorans]AKJ65308.1 CRISPR system Cascade subunit CasD [Kiritimatiella glycovorans]
MSDKCLLLYLDAPMQAWGYSSRYNRRASASWPVKSGIVGMLCAACGIERDDENGIARLAGLRMRVYTLRNSGERMIDYHTVGGGYDLSKNPGCSFSGKSEQSIAILTDREYLLDCKFGVLLSGSIATLQFCENALQDPRWGIWFGRKCCPPAARVCEGIFSSQEAAEARLREMVPEGDTANRWRVVRDADSFEDGSVSLMDCPVNFFEREFRTRRVADEVLD